MLETISVRKVPVLIVGIAMLVCHGGSVLAQLDDSGLYVDRIHLKNGDVITGNMKDPATGAQVAGRWTQATGWVALGGFDTCGSISSGYDIDGSGTKLVGAPLMPGSDPSMRLPWPLTVPDPPPAIHPVVTQFGPRLMVAPLESSGSTSRADAPASADASAARCDSVLAVTSIPISIASAAAASPLASPGVAIATGTHTFLWDADADVGPDAEGLAHDREWMVVDDSGRFLTQRELPRMALIDTDLTSEALILRAPGAGARSQ